MRKILFVTGAVALAALTAGCGYSQRTQYAYAPPGGSYYGDRAPASSYYVTPSGYAYQSNPYPSTTGYYYSPMILYLERNEHARAFALMEKGRASALNDAIMTRAAIELSDPGQADVYRRLQETREALVAVAPSSAESGALTKEYERLLGKARERYPELLTLVTAPSADLATVQRETQAGGFDLLEYVCLDGQLVVFHVGPSGTHAKSVFVLRKSLAEKAAALRRSLSDGRVAFDETTSRELYLFLVHPVREFLTTRHLVVIPHDALYSIPFSVLKDWPDGRFLADSFRISYSPSATERSRRRPRSCSADQASGKPPWKRGRSPRASPIAACFRSSSRRRPRFATWRPART